jgi:hypothetical protein
VQNEKNTKATGDRIANKEKPRTSHRAYKQGTLEFLCNRSFDCMGGGEGTENVNINKTALKKEKQKRTENTLKGNTHTFVNSWSSAGGDA